MVVVRRTLAALAWLSALVVVGLVIVSFGGPSEDTEATAVDDNIRPAIAVTYVEAAPEPIEDVERALATVEAKWSARIAAEVAGTIESIEVDAGDQVEPGMLLASLDARDFEIEVMRAEANARRLESTIANSERTVERQRQLAEGGHAAAATLQDAQTELAALREELSAARSELDRAERNLERAEIRAPHGGTVAERLVSEGDYVTAGTVILEIPRADRLQVRIPLPEAAAERLALGMLVRLKTVGAETPVEAQITHIHPHVTSSNRTITVVAEIDNPGGWRPGSSVTAEVVMDARDAIVVAPTSVVRRLAGNVIYVVDDGVARERAVTVGKRTRDQVEITSGLSAGDRVIVDGAGFLSEGTRIDARPHDRQPVDLTDPSLTALGEPVL